MAGKSKARGRASRKKSRLPVIKVGWKAVVITLLALVAFLSIPYVTIRYARDRGAVLPSGAKHFGIDISHYQSGIVWDSLKVMADSKGKTVRDIRLAAKIYPVEFVFIKATEGESMTDGRFRDSWTAAGNAGIARGAYHFFRSSKNPLRQAQNFISTVGELGDADLPPVLDIESMHRGCSKEQLNAAALVWLEEVEKHYGVKPIVYASDSYLREVLSSEVKKYPIWVAHYRTPSPIYLNWTYWQFADDAVVHGVSGKVDLSVRR